MNNFLKNVVFDLDNVIVNTSKLALDTAKTIGIGKNLSMDLWETYKISDVKEYNISEKEAGVLFQVMENYRQNDYELLPGAYSVIKYIYNFMWIPVITARREVPWEMLKFLFSENIHFDIVACGTGTGTADKTEAMKKMGKSILIDDSVQNCKSIYKNGLTPIVFNDNHNKNEKHNFKSVSNWKEIAELIDMPLVNYYD